MSFHSIAVMVALLALQVAAADEGQVSLQGSGTSNPSKFFWKTLDMFKERSKIEIQATYRSVGSGTGQKEFIGNADNNYANYNHFGSGDLPFSKTDYDAMNSRGNEVLQIPFVLGAIGIFYNIPELAGEKLDLDGCTLAKIFSSQINMWNHPDIVALNPDITLPSAPIKVVHRNKGSSSTSGTTEYLVAVTERSSCEEAWPKNSKNETNAGKVVEWSAITAGEDSSGGVATYIKDTSGSIGYLSAGHGHSEGFAEVELKNVAGTYLDTKTAAAKEGIAKAADVVLNGENSPIPVNGTGDWSNVVLYDQAGEFTWPIVQFSYFYVRKDLSTMDGKTAGLLKMLIEYTLSKSGQLDLQDSFSFFGVPQSVLNLNAATLNLITMPDSLQEFTLESSTAAYSGAGDYAISAKRKTYADVRFGSLEKAAKADADRINHLEAVLDSLVSHRDDRDDHDPSSVAVVGCIFGLVGTVLGAAAMYIAMTKKSSSRRPGLGQGESDASIGSQSKMMGNGQSSVARKNDYNGSGIEVQVI